MALNHDVQRVVIIGALFGVTGPIGWLLDVGEEGGLVGFEVQSCLVDVGQTVVHVRLVEGYDFFILSLLNGDGFTVLEEMTGYDVVA